MLAANTPETLKTPLIGDKNQFGIAMRLFVLRHPKRVSFSSAIQFVGLKDGVLTISTLKESDRIWLKGSPMKDLRELCATHLGVSEVKILLRKLANSPPVFDPELEWGKRNKDADLPRPGKDKPLTAVKFGPSHPKVSPEKREAETLQDSAVVRGLLQPKAYPRVALKDALARFTAEVFDKGVVELKCFHDASIRHARAALACLMVELLPRLKAQTPVFAEVGEFLNMSVNDVEEAYQRVRATKTASSVFQQRLARIRRAFAHALAEMAEQKPDFAKA